MMELYQFRHDEPVKAGCCGWETTTTFWLANSREQAEEEIKDETPEGREPSGLCDTCMADLLSDRGWPNDTDYTIYKDEKTTVYAVMVHPPEDNSYIAAVVGDRDEAERIRDEKRDAYSFERDLVAVQEYEVEL